MRKGHLTNPQGSHLSEANFRRFEGLIRDLVERHPLPLRFQPNGLRLTTASARFRDAVNAVLHHCYATSIDLNALAALWPSVIVLTLGDEVVVGARQQLHVEAGAAPIVATAPVPRSVDNPTPDVLSAFATLFQSGALSDPVTFSGNIPSWQPPIGVAFELQPNGTFLML